jgi:hypothetical protein
LQIYVNEGIQIDVNYRDTSDEKHKNWTLLHYAAAIGNFQKVIEIDPNDKDAKLNIEGLIKESKK